MIHGSYAIDTSALAAILFVESDASLFSDVLAAHPGAGVMSAPTLLESHMVIESRLGPAGGALLSELIRHSAIEIVPTDERAITIAMTAWRRFGKGTHGAALNYGDCLSYALAKGRGIPLLYKGRDFAQTDVMSVL